MKRLLAVSFVILGLFAGSARADDAPAAPEDNGTDFKRFSFDSLHYWKADRWYVIGRWSGPDTIRWLDGHQTTLQFPRPECLDGRDDKRIVRPVYSGTGVSHDIAISNMNREILTRRNWFAIEVAPEIETDTLEIRAPAYRDAADCVAKLELNYGWSGGQVDAKPVQFTKPTENYFDHEITIYPLEKSQQANIQLDLYLGYWSGSFPNAILSSQAAATVPLPKTTVVLLPVAISRGEWLLPWKKSIGLTLSLEQTLHSFGGVSQQDVFFSDWFAGAFYQHLFTQYGDGLQTRLFFKYHEHLADEGTTYATVAEPNRDAKNLILGGTANLYFGRRWLTGLDLEYGLPGHAAGRGVNQTYLSYFGRIGFRLTKFMLMVSELGVRSYGADGYANEKVTFLNGGIRLEL